MRYKKPLFIAILCLFFSPVLQAQVGGYEVSYETGQAPFKANTHLKISKNADAYLFVPAQGDAWSLPIKSLRGAILTAKGVWIYWFDDSGNTNNAFFEMTDSASVLAGDLNQSIASYYNNAPGSSASSDKLKATYEAYKEQALRESK